MHMARQGGYLGWVLHQAHQSMSKRSVQAHFGLLQGSAADLAKKAMINIHQTFKSLPTDGGRLQPRLLLQIHDELLFEVSHALCWAVCRAALSGSAPGQCLSFQWRP